MSFNNKRIVYENDEGGISIVVPAPGFVFEDVIKAVPHGKEYKVVDVSDIPTDRTFRNAWELSDD